MSEEPMTKEQLLEHMDKVYGRGAGQRWEEHCMQEKIRIIDLGREVGFGRMIQVAAEELGRTITAVKIPHPEIIRRLLAYSFGPTDYIYEGLTKSEQRIITREQFIDLAEWVKPKFHVG